MFTGFAHSELMSQLWPVRGIVPCTLTTGQTVNTYSVSPQPAAGIDTWIGGGALFRNLLILIDVASITTGTFTVSLRDDSEAITTANGDANSNLVATLADISAAGLYYGELIFEHVFAATTARAVIDADNLTVRRYQSIRATATGGTVVFSIMGIYGANCRDYPVQSATELAATWATSV
jgi:hypothetical protein